MSTVPASITGAVQFFEDHVALWANDPAAIGLSEADVTQLNGLTVAARSALTSASVAREASKGATSTLHGAVDSMRSAGGPMISAIRAFAEGSSDPMSIYGAAQIPPPASPSPYPAPGAPTKLTTNLDNNGDVSIAWHITQPAQGAQVFTVIWRRLNATGPFVMIGDTQAKQFTDANLPVGSTEVAYQLQAKAGGQSGPFSEPVTVYLGKPGSNQQGGQGQGQGGEDGLQIAA